jgi:hypothetical protein
LLHFSWVPDFYYHWCWEFWEFWEKQVIAWLQSQRIEPLDSKSMSIQDLNSWVSGVLGLTVMGEFAPICKKERP